MHEKNISFFINQMITATNELSVLLFPAVYTTNTEIVITATNQVVFFGVDKSLDSNTSSSINKQVCPIKLFPFNKTKNQHTVFDLLCISINECKEYGIQHIFSEIAFNAVLFCEMEKNETVHLDKDAVEYISTMGLAQKNDCELLFTWIKVSYYVKHLCSQKKFAEALVVCKKAYNEDNPDPDALFAFGYLSHQMHDFTIAQQFLATTICLSPSHIDALIQMGLVCIDKNEYENALAWFERAEAFKPKDPFIQKIVNKYTDFITNTIDETISKSFLLPQAVSSNEKNRPKNILVINNLFPPQELGGYGQAMFTFTEILKKRGYEILVLTSDTPYLGTAPKNEPSVSRCLQLFGGWRFGVAVCLGIDIQEKIIDYNLSVLREKIKLFTPDICLFGNVDFLGHELIHELISHHIPVLHRLGNATTGYSINQTPLSHLYHLATASNWLRTVIWSQGYPLKRISVVYPGALVQKFYQEKGKPFDMLRIVFAGILLPFKGPQVLIRALTRLAKEHIPFKATFAGKSTDQHFVEELIRTCKKNCIHDSVLFAGHLSSEELKITFSQNNILVFPSLVDETFGISQVEAMAAGALVISSCTGGASEIVEHGISGYRFKGDDDEDLAQILKTIASDSTEASIIRLQGQQKALNLFDSNKSVDKIEQLFSLLHQKKLSELVTT